MLCHIGPLLKFLRTHLCCAGVADFSTNQKGYARTIALSQLKTKLLKLNLIVCIARSKQVFLSTDDQLAVLAGYVGFGYRSVYVSGVWTIQC